MTAEFPILSGGGGAAFRLDRPAPCTLSLSHPDGQVMLRESAPYATVTLAASKDAVATRSTAWLALQEALDAFAAKSRVALQTSHGDSSYVLWVRHGPGYELVAVDTADASWSIQMTLSTGNAPSAVVERPMARHSALRFYRLSQASNDLFDAFRNAYLALECLVSDVDPKAPGEKELIWLKRVLNGRLAAAIPGGLHVDSTVDDIYIKGRNPIFHAKSGSTFYAPNGPERQEMQDLFERLTLLLVCLLQFKLGNSEVSRWASMSQYLNDAQAHSTFAFDCIAIFDGNQEVQLPTVAELIQAPRRFGQLWCRASVDGPFGVQGASSIDTRKGGEEWSTSPFEERIPLAGVVRVTIEQNVMQYNKRAPRPMHPK